METEDFYLNLDVVPTENFALVIDFSRRMALEVPLVFLMVWWLSFNCVITIVYDIAMLEGHRRVSGREREIPKDKTVGCKGRIGCVWE